MTRRGLRSVLFGLILCFVGLTAAAQSPWRVQTYGWEVDTMKYALREDGLAAQTGFYFPDYKYQDKPLTDGFVPFQKEQFEVPGREAVDAMVWRKRFATPVEGRVKKSYLYHRLFVEKIPSFTIYLVTEEGVWYENTFTIDFQRYQVPDWEPLSDWQRVTLPDAPASTEAEVFVDEEHPANAFSELIIAYESDEDAAFAIGDLQLFDIAVVERPYHHPLFDPITGQNSLRRLTNNSFYKPEGSSMVLTDMSFYSMAEHQYSDFYIVANDDEAEAYDSTALLVDVIEQVLHHYPFYAERGLEKADLLAQLADIEAEGLSYGHLIDRLRQFIAGFHDTHFFIPEETSRRSALRGGPVRLYEIDGRLYVAALFAPSLEDKLSLGDEVLAIDGEPVEKVIESRAEGYRGTPSARRRKAISQILHRRKDDTATITVASASGDTSSVAIAYNERLVVPANFRTPHAEFKLLDGNIAYFRMKEFSLEVWIRFLNHIEAIRQAQGIIFDLRGNGGGELLGGLRIVSTFLDRPAVFSHAAHLPGEDARESRMMAPHPDFDLDIPIVILGDKGTACASEVFIHTLRHYDDAVFVADSRTAGAQGARINIYLPDGLRIVSDSWVKEWMAPDGSVIETQGLTPDVWVWKNRVEDLAPYDDKVLQTGLRVIQAFRPKQAPPLIEAAERAGAPQRSPAVVSKGSKR